MTLAPSERGSRIEFFEKTLIACAYTGRFCRPHVSMYKVAFKNDLMALLQVFARRGRPVATRWLTSFAAIERLAFEEARIITPNWPVLVLLAGC